MRRSNRTTYVYDDANRLTSRRYPDANAQSTLHYDAIGERLVMADVNGRTTSTYDAVGQVTTVTNPAEKRLTYSYDAAGQRSRDRAGRRPVHLFL